MFFDFGAGEIIGLAVIAMILVGPERLPNFAVDAAKFVKKVRVMATNATTELKGNLGPGFENLQPTDLNPKTFLKKQVTDLLDDKPAAAALPAVKLDPDLL